MVLDWFLKDKWNTSTAYLGLFKNVVKTKSLFKSKLVDSVHAIKRLRYLKTVIIESFI